jgi:excisionase family DNA binding protein
MPVAVVTSVPTHSRTEGVAVAQTPEPFAYQVDAAVKATGLTRSRLYEAMRAGDLPYVQLGRRRLIRRIDLDTFLAANLVQRD